MPGNVTNDNHKYVKKVNCVRRGKIEESESE